MSNYIGDSKVSDTNFDLVCKYYKLSKEARKAAWDAARMHPVKAAKCYEAIVRSFGPAPGEIRRTYK